LAKTIREQGGHLEKSSWLRCDGKALNNFSFPKTDQPAVAVHRAALQQALASAVRADDSIHLDHVFEGYEEFPDRVISKFQNGQSFEADILIGADGVHSRAREQLLNDGPPTDHHYVAWRGVVSDTFSSVQSATATEIYGSGQRFGIGPLGAGRIGWWASANKSLHTDRNPRNSAQGTAGAEDSESIRQELLELFGNWCEPVPDLIRVTPLKAVVKNAVRDRPPAEKWGTGAISLLGDAIHPLTPNLGQGGCLAIEDAAVLARCIEKYARNASEPQIATALALRRFESARRTRTAWLARFSRAYGVIGQWETRSAVQLRDFGLSLVPKGLTARFLRSVFEYDAYAVRI
jgi:2-polyprenyl-6-methoxyphenol hydroxylase-like FAD-dependent oxidoreductase